MNTFAKRLTYALKKRRVNQSELAAGIGVKPQAIQYLCKKGTKSTKTTEICNFLKISADWLTTGEGHFDAYPSSLPSSPNTFSKVAESSKNYSKEAGVELTEEQKEWLQMFEELTPEARASLREGLRVAHKSTK